MGEVLIYTAPIVASNRANRYCAEREAVRALVAEAFGKDAELSHNADGKPFITECPNAYISVSHSKDECVLAVSDMPIGVDVETARPQLPRIAHKFLTAAETSREPLTIKRLMMLWTAKEAVFKCAGIPSLVISEIELSEDMTKAKARGLSFSISYHHISDSKVLAIASSDL